MKDNFFMVSRKANIKRLMAFIRENGFKTNCPKCNNELDQKIGFVKCNKCNAEWPVLTRTALLARFAIDFGATKKTIIDYLEVLQDAGQIMYVSEKDSYQAL